MHVKTKDFYNDTIVYMPTLILSPPLFFFTDYSFSLANVLILSRSYEPEGKNKSSNLNGSQTLSQWGSKQIQRGNRQ